MGIDDLMMVNKHYKQSLQIDLPVGRGCSTPKK